MRTNHIQDCAVILSCVFQIRLFHGSSTRSLKRSSILGSLMPTTLIIQLSWTEDNFCCQQGGFSPWFLSFMSLCIQLSKISGVCLGHESGSVTTKHEGPAKFPQILLTAHLCHTDNTSATLTSPCHPHIAMFQVMLFIDFFGLITGEFNYAAPRLLPGTTVVVETTFAYPPMAVNFQVFVEQPLPKSTCFKVFRREFRCGFCCGFYRVVVVVLGILLPRWR